MNTPLALVQSRFLAYLQSQDAQQTQFIQSLIQETGEITADRRLQIYHHAYRARLKEVIETDHPILGMYLGDELFDQMVEDYICHYPSHFFSLRQFADALPKFLSQQSPFNEHPQIAELARFERLLLAAFDAQDRPRQSSEDLARIPTAQWPDISLRFHPSVQSYSSKWDMVSVWKALKNADQPPELKSSEVHWLLWRNEDRVTEFRMVSPMMMLLFLAFQKGQNLATVCEQAMDWMPVDEISQTIVSVLTQWLDVGLIYKIKYHYS